MLESGKTRACQITQQQPEKASREMVYWKWVVSWGYKIVYRKGETWKIDQIWQKEVILGQGTEFENKLPCKKTRSHIRKHSEENDIVDQYGVSKWTKKEAKQRWKDKKVSTVMLETAKTRWIDGLSDSNGYWMSQRRNERTERESETNFWLRKR